MTVQVRTAPTILRRRQVEARTGLSRSTIYELMKQGTFPESVSLGEKAVGWVESEIDTWLIDLVQKSRHKSGIQGTAKNADPKPSNITAKSTDPTPYRITLEGY